MSKKKKSTARKPAAPKPAVKKVEEQPVDEVVETKVEESVEPETVEETVETVKTEEESVQEAPGITFVPVKGIGNHVFSRIVELVHSEKLEMMRAFREESETDAVQTQVIIGTPSKEDGHVIVSTFGLGSVEGNSFADVDGTKMGLRAELYGVAKNLKEAKILANDLASIVFWNEATKNVPAPGMVISQETGTSYLVGGQPLGLHSNHGQAPVFTEDNYMIAFFGVTNIKGAELQMVTTAEGFNQFEQYITGLGLDAYTSTRPEYSNQESEENAADGTATEVITVTETDAPETSSADVSGGDSGGSGD